MDQEKFIKLYQILKDLPEKELLWLALQMKVIEFVNYKKRTPTFRIRPRHRDNPSLRMLWAQYLFTLAARRGRHKKPVKLPDGREVPQASIEVQKAFQKYWDRIREHCDRVEGRKELSRIEKARLSARRALATIFRMVYTFPPSYRPLIYRLAQRVLSSQSRTRSE